MTTMTFVVKPFLRGPIKVGFFMCRTLSSIENVYYNLQQFNVGFMGGAADC